MTKNILIGSVGGRGAGWRRARRAKTGFPRTSVVVDGLRAKTKYNGKTGVVRGPLGANGRFPVAVNMTQGVETIALKVANLRAADE